MTIKSILSNLSIPMIDIQDADWNHPGEWIIMCYHTKGYRPHGDKIEKDFRKNIVTTTSFGQLLRYVELLKEERFRFNGIDIMTMRNNDESDITSGANVVSQWVWDGEWITEEEFNERYTWEEYKVIVEEWKKEWNQSTEM